MRSLTRFQSIMLFFIGCVLMWYAIDRARFESETIKIQQKQVELLEKTNTHLEKLKITQQYDVAFKGGILVLNDEQD